MNKLIYAIGIAVATSFTANTKSEKNTPDPVKKQGIEQIEEFPTINKQDSVITIIQ